jgi:hypothetical protein
MLATQLTRVGYHFSFSGKMIVFSPLFADNHGEKLNSQATGKVWEFWEFEPPKSHLLSASADFHTRQTSDSLSAPASTT